MGVTALSVSKRHARVVVLRLSAMRLNIIGLMRDLGYQLRVCREGRRY